jgi:hypothetical protein
VDGPGGLVDRIVDDRQLALGELGLVVAAVGQHRQRARRLLLVNLVQVFLGKREVDEDRLRLSDRDQAVGVVAVDHVADIDEPHAEPARDRRADVGVAEVELGGFDQGLVGLGRRLQLRDLRLLLVIALPGLIAGGHQLGIAGEVGLRAGQLRLVLFLLRQRLVERRLERPGIDLDQRGARLDLLTLGEIDVDDLAVDPALDCNRIEGLHRPDPVQDHRHIGRLDRARRDRDAGRGSRRGRRFRCRRGMLDDVGHRRCRGDGEDRARGDRSFPHAGPPRWGAEGIMSNIYYRQAIPLVSPLFR